MRDQIVPTIAVLALSRAAGGPPPAPASNAEEAPHSTIGLKHIKVLASKRMRPLGWFPIDHDQHSALLDVKSDETSHGVWPSVEDASTVNR